VAPNDEYTGCLLGVSCSCTLYEGYAALALRGVPIGGELRGNAWFEEDGKRVVLDRSLHSAVRRRMVSIHEARYNAADDTVAVSLSVPIFGLRKITLIRRTSASLV
jgi:hypothetical protein